LIERDGALLLVQNRRRNGSLDWSPPGGVVEVAEGESVLEGLTREVEEETGIVVREWSGPVYQVEAVADGLGWSLHAEVHWAVSFDGRVAVDDPDGIVDAAFVPTQSCVDHLAGCHPWVREPLDAWLRERWERGPCYRYRVDGVSFSSLTVTRTGGP
jgi:8-oxo-dGTP diphosphatase